MNVPINIGGKSYDLEVADGTPQERIDARIKELGGFQERGWGEWVKRLVIPQTPTEWGIALATLPLGFGAGGAAGRALTVAGRPFLAKLAGGAAGRIATLAAGGAVGAAVGQATSEEEQPSIRSGAVQGLLAGLAGEGAGALLKTGTNVMMRNFIRKVDNPRALAAYQQMLLPQWAEHLQSKSPAEQFAYIMSDIGDQTRGNLIANGMQRAQQVAEAKGQWVGNKYQPELGKWLRDAGWGPKYPDNDMMSLYQAMDGYMRIGPTIFKEGFSQPGQRDGAKQFQSALLDKLYREMGPDAAKIAQDALHGNAVFKQWTRFLKSTPDTFMKNGGLDFGPAQDAAIKMFLGQDAKTIAARKKLGGDMTDKLVDTLWRGGQPLSAGDIDGGIGFSIGLSGYPRLHRIGAPSFAGDPYQLGKQLRPGMGVAITSPLFNQPGGAGGMLPSTMQ